MICKTGEFKFNLMGNFSQCNSFSSSSNGEK